MINLAMVSPLFFTQVVLAVDQDLSTIESILNVGIGIFSLLLFALSISAYRRTGVKRLVYAAIAFGLFAVQSLFEYVKDIVTSFEPLYDTLIFPGITLSILIMFFLASVSRK
jgi:hypothetical protein